jgi:hypothetical protein
MASDQVVARELKSLQEELSAAQRERSTAPAALPTQAPSQEDSSHASEGSLKSWSR